MKQNNDWLTNQSFLLSKLWPFLRLYFHHWGVLNLTWLQLGIWEYLIFLIRPRCQIVYFLHFFPALISPNFLNLLGFVTLIFLWCVTELFPSTILLTILLASFLRTYANTIVVSRFTISGHPPGGTLIVFTGFNSVRNMSLSVAWGLLKLNRDNSNS